MKRRRRSSSLVIRAALTCLALLATGSLVFAQEQGGAPIQAPQRLFSNVLEYPYPLWISAEAARGDNSLIDSTQFAQTPLEMIESHIAAAPTQVTPSEIDRGVELISPADCLIETVKIPWLTLPEFENFTDLARNSRTVFLGEVVEVTPGFYLGIPTSLLTVRTDWLDSDEGIAAGEVLSIVYPQGSFSIDGVPFCGGQGPSNPPIEQGSRLLLLAAYGSGDRDGKMFVGSTDIMAVIGPDGGVVVGRDLLFDEDSRSLISLDDLVQVVDRARDGGTS